MKILKVEFENINSLAGHWCIDFQDESYKAAHNIFVICGPTGAGKTTILDAITLAIYGRTPRQLPVITNSANEFMTRATRNCFARVTYECETGTYVSEWNQTSSKPSKNSPGKLQTPHFKISKILGDSSLETVSEGDQKTITGNATKILTAKDKKSPKDQHKATLLEIESSKIIKLDYRQFCRSIMLAQGEFSKFLTSTDVERASILEKMNGSSKYRSVAVKVYARYSEAKQNFELLNSQLQEKQSSIKSQEELDECAEQQKKHEAELNTLFEENNENVSLLNWYNELKIRKEKLSIAQKELQKANENSNGFEAERLVLERGREAQNCETAYQTNKNLHSAQKAAEQTLSENNKKENDLTIKAKDCENKLNKQRTNLEALKSSFENDSKLYTTIRQYDEEIRHTEKEKNEKEALKNESRKELTTLEANNTNLINELEAQKKDLTEKKQYIEAHNNDGKISDSLSDIKFLADKLKSAENDINTNKTKSESQQKELKIQNKKLEALLVNEETLIQERGNLIENNITVIVDVLQGNLLAGAPCPVCGSKDHPYCEDSNGSEKAINNEKEETVTDIAKKLKEINKQIDNIRKDKNTHTVRITGINNEIEALKEKISAVQSTFDNEFKQLEDLILPWHSEQFALSELDEICEALVARSDKYGKIYEAIGKLETNIAAQEKALATNCDALKEKKEKYLKHEKNFNETANTLDELKKKRSELFGNKSVDEEEKAAKARINDAEKEIKESSELKDKITEELNTLKGIIKNLSDSISNRENEITESDQALADKLKEYNFESREAFENARLSSNEIAELKEKEERIKTALIQTKQSLEIANNDLSTHKQKHPSIEPEDVIAEKQKSIKAKMDMLRESIANLSNILKENSKNKSEYQELLNKFEKQKAEFDKWNYLHTLCGDKEGDDLSVFVQNITFKNLIKLANKHLSQMKDRYRLSVKGEGLDLEIQDVCCSEPRVITNLSGGEKFLVCLALALGIADFASKNIHMDSLFLDEGFGSLDTNVLDDVLTCLKREQKNGKLLGIITHVDAVVQSIDQRIEVTPTINGHSRITGPGVSNG